LEGPERAATGAIKDALYSDHIPQDHDEAIAYLMEIKNRMMRERE
jgi:hypothetical protein